MEKKSKKSIYCTILLIGFLSLAVSLMTDSSYAMSFDSYHSQANENHQKSLWKLGENLNEGDSFIYRICDGSIPDTFIFSHCYTVDLTFVSLMESSSGSMWIVQGLLIADDKETPLILQIDPVTFDVITDKSSINLANSLEKTIFSLSGYEKKSLKVGTVWDSLDSYFTNDVSLEIKKNKSAQLSFGVVEASILGYDVIIESSHFINDKFPFPVLATTYSPNIIFPEPLELYNYELIQYSSYDTESNQVIHSICFENPEMSSNDDFDDFFVNVKNSTSILEALP